MLKVLKISILPLSDQKSKLEFLNRGDRPVSSMNSSSPSFFFSDRVPFFLQELSRFKKSILRFNPSVVGRKEQMKPKKFFFRISKNESFNPLQFCRRNDAIPKIFSAPPLLGGGGGLAGRNRKILFITKSIFLQ